MDQNPSVTTNEQTVATPESVAAKKKSFKRSLISMLAITVVAIIIFSAQTVAYFTDDNSTGKNVIQSGNLDIELIEMTEVGGSQVLYTNPVSVMPATSVSKIVSVHNAGTLPVYVRVSLETAIHQHNQEKNLPDYWQSLITCNINAEYWTYQNGYFYYNLPLEPGKSTAPLFDTVSFSPAMGNEFTNSEITLTVTSEATQSNGTGETATTATGWPTSAATTQE